MKKILFSALFITSIGAFAQLSVRPVPSGPDSFIYVKGEIVYVEDAVTLSQNNTAGQEASIYLRDGGQLIQGGTTSTNDGNGFLSVQRPVEGTNAFAYNDWASPVGNSADIVGTSVGNNKHFGISSVYEPLDGEHGIEARMSATTTGRDGFKIPRLTISTRWLYTLKIPGTEAEGDYQRFNANNIVPAGYGYTMKGVGPSSSRVVYEFRGRPNSGNFEIPVGANTNDIPAGSPNGKMTLSGNPYPSALDLTQVFYDEDNTALQAIWFYDEDRSVLSHLYRNKPYGYGSWVPSGDSVTGTYTAAPFYIWNAAGDQTSGQMGTGSEDQNKRFSPIGQGFRLIGLNDGIVTIKNEHRVFVKEGADNGSVFQRPDSDTEITASNARGMSFSETITQLDDTNTPPNRDYSQVRLYAVFDGALTRDMVLGFSRNATDGFDRGQDGISAGGISSDAYFPIDIDGVSRPFVINTTKFSYQKKIPITFKLHKPSRINLKVVEEINKPYQKLYLFDRLEHTYLELSGDDSRGILFGLPAGTYEDRFFLTFERDNIEVLPWPKEALEDFQANVNLFQNNPAQRLQVSNPEGYKLKSINVYDMSGKLVISESNLGDNTNYSFFTGNLSDGVYLVKLTTVDDMIIDYKSVIMNK